MSNNSIESQSPLSWILAGPCFANKLTVLLWVFRNRLTPRVYRHPLNTTHLYDFIQCWTNVEDVGPTLYKCYTNDLCWLGRTSSQTLYISAMLVQCWASVADVDLTLKQRWVSVRWSSIQSYNQITSSTTLYCMLKAYTHASLEPDSIFNHVFLWNNFTCTLSEIQLVNVLPYFHPICTLYPIKGVLHIYLTWPWMRFY